MSSEFTIDKIEEFKDSVRRHCEKICTGSQVGYLGTAQIESARFERPLAAPVHSTIRSMQDFNHRPLVRDELFNDPIFPNHSELGRPASSTASPTSQLHKQDNAVVHPPCDAEVILNERELRVDMFVSDYLPNELTVNVVGELLVISGKHEEQRPRENANITRQFCRRYALPDDSRPDGTSVLLDKRGVISVTVPRGGARVTPIYGYGRPTKAIEKTVKFKD